MVNMERGRIEGKVKQGESEKRRGGEGALNVGQQDRRRKESMCLRWVGGAWRGRGWRMDGRMVEGGWKEGWQDGCSRERKGKLEGRNM